MSASSHSIFSGATHPPPPLMKPQLNYDDLVDLLCNGLIEFIICFTEEGEKVRLFSESFAKSLINNFSIKINYNLNASLFLKASFPQIFKLKSEETDILLKMGILDKYKGPDVLIGQFFKKEEVCKFIEKEVKDKYKIELLNVVDIVYKFIVTASCSIECEKAISEYYKNSEVGIFSSLDLQFSNAISNLKITSDKVIKEKGKTTKTNAITKSLEKIRSILNKACNEYTKNVADHQAFLLKKQTKAMATVIDQTKIQLDETRLQLEASHKAKLVAEELVLTSQEELQHQTRRAEELEKIANERKLALEALMLEKNLQQSVSAPASAACSSSGEIETLKRQNVQLQIDNKIQRILTEAKNSKVDKKTVEDSYQVIIREIEKKNINDIELLKLIIKWEKLALSYLINKTVSATSKVAGVLPNFMVSSIGYLGKLTHIGNMKACSQEDNLSMRNFLINTLEQCLTLFEIDNELIPYVNALNQNGVNLQRCFPNLINKNTVASQFISILATLKFYLAEKQLQIDENAHKNGCK